jgi:fatty acid desaturase
MENKYFKRRNDLVSLLIVVAHFAVVIGPVYWSAVIGPGAHLFFAWLVFGLGMNGIINLMHECAHYLVFKEKWGSTFLGKFVIAPLLFTNFDVYRKRHWEHHKHLGVEGETKDTYLIDIKGSHIVMLLIRCLLCFEAAKKFLKQFHTIVEDDTYQHDKFWQVRTLGVQSVFFASLLASAYFWGGKDWEMAFMGALAAYVFVYMYGVMSLSVFVADLRAIAEHQMYPSSDAHEGYAALRNFKCNALTRFIMGAYGFGEHYTHHKIPGIPYYALKDATSELARTDTSLDPKKGYFQTILEITKDRDIKVK